MKGKINLRQNKGEYVSAGIFATIAGLWLISYTNGDVQNVVLGSIFVTVGVLATGYMNRLTYNSQLDALVHQKGLVFPLLNKRYKLSKIRKITITAKQESRNSENSYQVYPIRLTGIKDAVVLKKRDPWFSRHIAEKIAKKINLPLDNRAFQKSSVRMPDELDMSLIQRWEKNGVRHSKPLMPDTSQLLTNMGVSFFEVSIKAERHNIKFALPLLLVFISLAVFLFPQSNKFPIFYYFFFGVSIPFLSTALLSFSGQSNLKITPTKASFRQGYSPFRHSIRIDEIEELIAANDGINLVGDRKAICIDWGDNKADSEYLASIIPYEIYRLGKRGGHRL